MITEDYVNLETAKLLKEKGFNEICEYEYGVPNVDKGYVLQKWTITNGQIKNSDLIDGAYTAPTQSFALKWLREVHGLNVQPYIVRTIELKRAYNVTIYDNNCEQIKSHFGSNIFDGFISYEDAVEAAILYVLKNLI